MAGVRRRGSGAVVTLDADETALLRVLLADLDALLDAPQRPSDPLEELAGLADAPTTPPEDPALSRLLPDGYRDDPEAAASLRRLTENSLRQQKSEAARVVLAGLPEKGGKIRLDEESLPAWLAALNDLRLVLGTRLDVTEESDPLGGHAPQDPEAAPYVIYQWLTAVQDNLVQTLLR
ncbi:MAG TPA: DUF2017 domain-containing protein [Mycobacteriales bacterium]|nr:DUF2017 domain-containing protein [Mycobacteriales bacterium]